MPDYPEKEKTILDYAGRSSKKPKFPRAVVPVIFVWFAVIAGPELIRLLVQLPSVMNPSVSTAQTIEAATSIIGLAAIVALGFVVPIESRRPLVLASMLAGIPMGFDADVGSGSTDGPSCSFIGSPLTCAVLIYIGVGIRAIYDRSHA
jgi:hypothetical protein